MLDKILPVQFVEGMNEGAGMSGVDSLVITGYLAVGVLYAPTVSYSLVRLEIMLTFGELREGAQIEVELHSDYDGKPSDIVLASGSFVPKILYGEWREVTFTPVSVLRNMRYWVVVHPGSSRTAFVVPKDGTDYVLNVKPQANAEWEAPREDVKNRKLMLKFHGRLLPLSVS